MPILLVKIAVWRTGHDIADTVAEAVIDGLSKDCLIKSFSATFLQYDDINWDYFDCHVGYGILRGMDEVFRACDKAKKPWFNIDKGYWKPGHYNGYYRISLRGTQQTFGLDKIKPDYERWDKLGFEILPSINRDGRYLICPPTDHACNFMGIHKPTWIGREIDILQDFEVREKGTNIPIKYYDYSRIVTFNSSVGWEALRQGIPVVSDPTHSIVGAYQKMLDIDLSKDSNERRKFFAIQAGLQLRLDEFKSGALWPLLQTLLTIN